ncbi:MAG: hypothetical protein WEC33_04420 [Dehalococcoidia bacterium]
MTARQPRRPRRRVPAASLPRPGQAASMRPTAAAPQGSATRREHHIEQDYGYVFRDLILVAAVSAVALAFILVMAFIL